METKYPEIEVQLSGEDGNAFAIIGRVSKAIRTVSREDANEFSQKCFSAGSYDEVLRLCMEYVTVL
jgi:hypothetical protein